MAEDPDRERVPLRDRNHRVGLDQLGTQHVEREARAGHVRDRQVVEPRARHRAGGHTAQRVGEQPERAQHRLGSGGPPGALERDRSQVHPREPGARVRNVERQGHERQRDAVAERVLLALAAHAHRDHRLERARLITAREAQPAQAPATVARQTSLSVTGPTCFVRSTSSIITECRTSARLGPMRALSADAGAGRSRSSPAARPLGAACRRAAWPWPAARWLPALRSARSAATRRRRRRAPRPPAAPRPERGAALQGAGTAGIVSGEVSNSRAPPPPPTSRPRARGGSSRPRRSGRPGAAGPAGSPRAAARAAGGPRARRRTGRRSGGRRARCSASRARARASTRRSRDRPPRMARRGRPADRRAGDGSSARARAARRCCAAGGASDGRGPPSRTRKVALHATCMCALAVSRRRNEPSIAERRSGMETASALAARKSFDSCRKIVGWNSTAGRHQSTSAATPPRRGSPPPVSSPVRGLRATACTPPKKRFCRSQRRTVQSEPSSRSRAGRRSRARPPPRDPPRVCAGARPPPRRPAVVHDPENGLEDRRADPVRAGAAEATSGRPSRSTTVGAIMLGTRAPGSWRWNPSGFRSCSPSMLLRCTPVPGTTTPEHDPFEQVTVAQPPSTSITEM